MIAGAFLILTTFLAIMTFVCLYRAYKGPTSADRVIAINVIATKVTVLIVLLAMMTDQDSFVDVAIVYAMMGFITTVCVSKYMEKGKLF
ncbi:monovalent cation/H+ antiporter complex subunit F [Alkaliphilus peptidifermentans]|uniref:Multisubunit sodium/proton antiporter, MrpF subunit n=1 Tax=Alkaliphilus peptidifermentans DSM 18978 TaxID=1120976 RepID=A0A1G5GEN9_9FIRM|nr:monovalent cation/H+ antiporter complex subunit F [Alkaliphilus peptidifermentans]SCY49817.1 multisubunit sodium/proton antiporter, MrpF subunit [Alkaliphilus peptidifermentans DSM 18978]